jgi:hypothetical protein
MTEPRVVEIAECTQCPWYRKLGGQGGVWCCCFEYDTDDEQMTWMGRAFAHADPMDIPDDCPLRAGPVLVGLAADEAGTNGEQGEAMTWKPVAVPPEVRCAICLEPAVEQPWGCPPVHLDCLQHAKESRGHGTVQTMKLSPRQREALERVFAAVEPQYADHPHNGNVHWRTARALEAHGLVTISEHNGRMRITAAGEAFLRDGSGT